MTTGLRSLGGSPAGATETPGVPEVVDRATSAAPAGAELTPALPAAGAAAREQAEQPSVAGC